MKISELSIADLYALRKHAEEGLDRLSTSRSNSEEENQDIAKQRVRLVEIRVTCWGELNRRSALLDLSNS